MKKYKVAIVGCGRIAPLHAESLINNDHAILKAAVDINEERLNGFVNKYSINGYRSFDEMILHENIQAVHICTPHYLHEPMAIMAMKKGIHVLTEKPMAISLESCKKMVNFSIQYQVNLGVVFQNRYNDSSQKAKELIDNHCIGEIEGVKAILCWCRTQEYYDSDEWRGTWQYEGGGMLINQAIHTIDLLQWLLSKPYRVEGSFANRCHPKIETEDVAEAVLCFKSFKGIIYATINNSYNSPIELEIKGKNGIIIIRKEEIFLKNNLGQMKCIQDNSKNEKNICTGKDYWGSGHQKLINDYYTSLANSKKFWIDGEEGTKALEIVLSIYESARMGRAVYLSN